MSKLTPGINKLLSNIPESQREAYYDAYLASSKRKFIIQSTTLMTGQERAYNNIDQSLQESSRELDQALKVLEDSCKFHIEMLRLYKIISYRMHYNILYPIR
jgi:hypothetical protein